MVIKKRTLDRKKMIVEKARKLMWEKGYTGTSMRDIARASSLEAASIYNYFHTKEELLYQILSEELESQIDLVQHLDNDTSSSPVDQLHFIITNQVTHALLSKRNSRLLFDVELRNLKPAHLKKIIAMRNQYELIVRKIIRRGINTGDFVEIDEKLATIMMFSMIIRLKVWFSSKGKLSTDEIANFIHKLILNSILKNGEKRLSFDHTINPF